MKKLVKMLLKVILFLILVSIIAKFTIDYLIKDTQSLNYGTYELPGGYSLEKISAFDNLIADKDQHTIVQGNVTHVAFNDDYILYKRKQSGLEVDYGLISIQDSKNMAITLDDPILVEIGLSETMLIPLADLYPETRKQN